MISLFGEARGHWEEFPFGDKRITKSSRAKVPEQVGGTEKSSVEQKQRVRDRCKGQGGGELVDKR